MKDTWFRDSFRSPSDAGQERRDRSDYAQSFAGVNF